MTNLLELAMAALGLWLGIAPFVFHLGTIGVCVDVACGILFIILALVAWKSKEMQGNFIVALVFGVALVVWGVVAVIVFDDAAVGANEVIVGVLEVLLSALCLPFQVQAKDAQFFNRGGGELARITKISEKNGDLLAKTVLLNSMPETIFIKPEELCKMISLIDFKVVTTLPCFLYAGWKANRQDKKARTSGADDSRKA